MMWRSLLRALTLGMALLAGAAHAQTAWPAKQNRILLLAPAKTPPEIIGRINRAAIDALASRELRVTGKHAREVPGQMAGTNPAVWPIVWRC